MMNFANMMKQAQQMQKNYKLHKQNLQKQNMLQRQLVELLKLFVMVKAVLNL